METVQDDHELVVVMKLSTTAVVDNHACVPDDDKKQNGKVKPLMTAKTTLSPDANTPSIPNMPSVDKVSGGRALDNPPVLSMELSLILKIQTIQQSSKSL